MLKVQYENNAGIVPQVLCQQELFIANSATYNGAS